MISDNTLETVNIIDSEESEYESDDRDDWRSDVIKGHFETSKMVDEALSGLKETSEDAQDLLMSTISVSDMWNSYQDKFKLACKKLGERIEADEREREEMMKKYGRVFKRGHHHKLSTNATIVRQQAKFIRKERKSMNF
ncbi:unnamed protein product [Moneuplotes crassus]|uniref:Uncharacterized protein n=1 Tax=Euplotes crassus TaxID=5936 RepID=A0AAD2D6I4_EUPCR|nr:unnamed protein product [Moneuplotes crassus]